ncbi:MAG: hypothetical protein P8Y13_16755 [Deinococcales bacterium]
MGAFPTLSRASLRGLLIALTFAAMSAFAAAQGPDAGNGGPKGGPPEGAGPGAVEEAGAPAGGEGSHVLVAPLRFAASGTLVVDGGRVDAPTDWARFLAPGMWLRLEGRWDGDTFRATTVEVARPAYFSYYLGPAAPVGLGDGWVEAWFTTDRPGAVGAPFEVRRIDQSRAPLALARWNEGAWVALPPGLEPPASTTEGWSLFRGRPDGDAVRWTSAAPFP